MGTWRRSQACVRSHSDGEAAGHMKKTREQEAATDEEKHLLPLLMQMVQVHRRIRTKRDLPYSCPEDIVMQLGRWYRPQPLPNGFEYGEKKQCFLNSAALSLHEGLTYVEGFALLPGFPLPIHHAWCSHQDSVAVIDVTSSNLVEYLGIPFRTAVVASSWKSRCGQSLLDNSKGKFPVLRMSQDQIHALIQE